MIKGMGKSLKPIGLIPPDKGKAGLHCPVCGRLYLRHVGCLPYIECRCTKCKNYFVHNDGKTYAVLESEFIRA